MKDPKRLLSGAGTDVERALLQAGRIPAPRGAKRRALLAASAAATTSLTVGGAAAEGGVAMAKAGSLVALKWIGVIAVTSVGIAGSAAALHETSTHEIRAMLAQYSPGTRGRHPAPTGPKGAVSAKPPEPVVEAAQPAAAGMPSPSGAVAALPVTATSMRAPARSTGATADPGGPARPGTARQFPSGSPESHPLAGSTLHPELALLDRARSALAGEDTAAALAILDDYDVRFPGGEMAPEATVLRIETLRKMGDMGAASRTAKRFLDRNPRSPYSSRIESLLSDP